MKKINKGLQVAGASAAILLVAGCATEIITADYVMPPKVIKDIKAVNTMAITHTCPNNFQNGVIF